MKILKQQELNFKKQSCNFKERRLKETKVFIDRIEPESKILVIGLEEFERKVVSDNVVIGTTGDYNYSEWEPLEHCNNYKTVFCFEVIEHLLNPLLFLERLHLYITEDTKIYISLPSGSRPRFLWTPAHFHEYKKDRVEALFNLAGYRIIKHEVSKIIWEYPKDYLKGIRPLMRFFFPLRIRFYELRLKT